MFTLQVTLKMTPELKQQLFEEKPHIRRAYTVLVPQSVSEKDFWQRFFQYEFARKVGVACLPCSRMVSLPRWQSMVADLQLVCRAREERRQVSLRTPTRTSWTRSRISGRPAAGSASWTPQLTWQQTALTGTRTPQQLQGWVPCAVASLLPRLLSLFVLFVLGKPNSWSDVHRPRMHGWATAART